MRREKCEGLEIIADGNLRGQRWLCEGKKVIRIERRLGVLRELWSRKYTNYNFLSNMSDLVEFFFFFFLFVWYYASGSSICIPKKGKKKYVIWVIGFGSHVFKIPFYKISYCDLVYFDLNQTIFIIDHKCVIV